MLAALLLPASLAAQSAVVLSEPFAYSDGLLTEATDQWRNRVGQPPITVLDNRVLLAPAPSEVAGYLTANLPSDITAGPVYASFEVRLPTLPEAASAARPILSFTDRSGAFGRAFVMLDASPAGWRLGLANSLTSTITWAATVFPAGTAQRVSVGYDTTTALTRLWLGESPIPGLPAASFTGTARSMGRVALHSPATDSPVVPELSRLQVATSLTLAQNEPVATAVLPPAGKFLLFLLIGQSNMSGRGVAEPADTLLDNRILVYDEARTWQVARHPLHFDGSIAAVGPGLEFARQLLRTLPPDVSIGLIPASQGGTSIISWGKSYAGSFTYYGGQYLYPHALGRAREAAAFGTMMGVLWNQGEADASAAEGNGGSTYRTRLHALVSDLRADLGVPALPFVAATLGPWRAGSDAINSVFLQLPGAISNTGVVNTLDPTEVPFLNNKPDDPTHYDAASARHLGGLYAAQMRPLIEVDPAYNVLRTNLTRLGNEDLTLDFNTTGALSRARLGETDLLADAALGQWQREPNTGAVVEPLEITANPPLSLKWRSPRAMAAWTAGAEGHGLVAANNDLNPARWSTPLRASVVTAVRRASGAWATVAAIAPGESISEVLLTSPDGRRAHLRGDLQRSPEAAAADRFTVDLVLAPRAVAAWDLTAGSFPLTSPTPYAVFQRRIAAWGRVPFAGLAPVGSTRVELVAAEGATVPGGTLPEPLIIPTDPATGAFARTVVWPAGGWFRARLRAYAADGSLLAERAVPPFGVGEVFVLAGQSNSTNSGEARIRPASGLVSTFSGNSWRLADDPQPGSHDNGDGGSFHPAMGDALVARFGVPVGIASSGQSASAVRHWARDYAPNFVSNTFLNGLYAWTHFRLAQFGPGGVRGLLWHQGESDSSQGQNNNPADEQTYYLALRSLLLDLRADLGWDLPAYTAKASLWPVSNAVYGGDPYIRAAQQRIWDDGLAFPGADSDTLGLPFRESTASNASRVHFNADGLRAHGSLWATAIGDRLAVTLAAENDTLDTDADGLPDTWERLHLLDPATALAPTTDTDGDGRPDLVEYLAGTDPRDPTSRAELWTATPTATDWHLTFRRTPGWTTVLETSPTPAGPWTATQSWPAPVVATEETFTLPIPSTSQFHRLRFGRE